MPIDDPNPEFLEERIQAKLVQREQERKAALRERELICKFICPWCAGDLHSVPRGFFKPLFEAWTHDTRQCGCCGKTYDVVLGN